MPFWKRNASEPSRRDSTVEASRLREPVPRSALPRLQYYLGMFPRHLHLVGCALVFCVFGYIFWQYLYRSTYFDVREWEIIGCERLEETQVEALVRSEHEGAISLLQFDTDSAAGRLNAQPLVFHAYVSKYYPESIQVVLQERRERMLLVSASENYLVDAEGVLMALASREDLLDPELPIITCSEKFEIGAKLPQDFTDSAILYIETVKNSGNRLADELSEVNWSRESGITLYLKSGTRLICGELEPVETLPRAAALWAKLGTLANVDYVDLRLENDLPWRPYSARNMEKTLAEKPG